MQQTVNGLSDPEHPYRQKLNTLFNNRVEIYQKSDLLQGSNFNPTVVKDQLSIFVMSFASLRANNKEDRKVFQENGQLESFVSHFKNSEHILDGVDAMEIGTSSNVTFWHRNLVGYCVLV